MVLRKLIVFVFSLFSCAVLAVGVDATGVTPRDVNPSGLRPGGGGILTKANAAQLLEGKIAGSPYAYNRIHIRNGLVYLRNRKVGSVEFCMQQICRMDHWKGLRITASGVRLYIKRSTGFAAGTTWIRNYGKL